MDLVAGNVIFGPVPGEPSSRGPYCTFLICYSIHSSRDTLVLHVDMQHLHGESGRHLAFCMDAFRYIFYLEMSAVGIVTISCTQGYLLGCNIIFLHAVLGCDTIPHTCWHWKGHFSQILQGSRTSQCVCYRVSYPQGNHIHIVQMTSLSKRPRLPSYFPSILSTFPIHTSWEPDQSYHVKMAPVESLSW